MIIAVASGKGGTGKTTIATSLALSIAAEYQPVATMTPAHENPLLLDCDVEAPNAHLFLKPVFRQREEVGILIPQVDLSKCNFCGVCAQVCQYGAIAVMGENVLVFPELCHGCGSCSMNCPEGAITEVPDIIGVLEGGETPSGIHFAHGVMNVGEPMAVPIISQLKKWIPCKADQTVILDVPPGTSCPVVESIRGADFLLLVTEPTPFGLHDLKLAVQLAEELAIPTGVIVNRDGVGNARVDDFCREKGIPTMMHIPFDRRIAEGIAQGRPLVEIRPEYREKLRHLYQQILKMSQEVAV
jgi:MinD superfamily P-loop ATPase